MPRPSAKRGGDVPNIFSNDINVVKKAINDGTDKEAKYFPLGLTPLHYACYNLDKDLVSYFISIGSNIECTTENGYTPLLTLLGEISQKKEDMRGDRKAKTVAEADISLIFDIVKIFLDAGANIEAEDPDDGKTPLMYACLYKIPNFVKLLLDKGASIDKQDHKGNTPLHFAIRPDRESTDTENTKVAFDMVKMLVSRNADIYIANGLGQTPSDFATRIRFDAVVRYLSSLDQINYEDLDVGNAVLTGDTEFIGSNIMPNTNTTMSSGQYFYDISDIHDNKIIRVFDKEILQKIASGQMKSQNPFTLKPWPRKNMKVNLKKIVISSGGKMTKIPYEKRLKRDLLGIAEKKKIKHAKSMTKLQLINVLRK